MDQTLPVQIPAYPHAVLSVYQLLESPINLAITAERMRFQLAICLPLLKNATDTFIENFAA